MNVGQLMQALSMLDPDLPVVIMQEEIELVGTYVELMSIEHRANLPYRDPKQYAANGVGYTNPRHGFRGHHSYRACSCSRLPTEISASRRR